MDNESGLSPALRKAQTFPRLEPPVPMNRVQETPLGSQAGMGFNPVTAEKFPVFIEDDPVSVKGDVFANLQTDGDSKDRNDQTIIRPGSAHVQESFDCLPIELISLTDRFVESLFQKVYTTPPSIERLADLFQGFYIRAGAHISTHISTLSSRHHRRTSPSQSLSSRSSSIASLGNKMRQTNSKDSLQIQERSIADQQMLTTTEVVDKRRLRRELEQKRVAMEEAVERRVCEAVYDKIWRHGSSLDEVKDEKLRSRTAALSLVGIGLHELGVDLNLAADGGQETKHNEDELARGRFSEARERLVRMNDERYPLGKLQHLAAAHKSIVDVLSTTQTSSSSADEILPTLIYTLLTTPTEGINVISNLRFIQRFRAANKVDGEAAYCLTNLEAAISFLETVDLASLRADEALEGPLKASSRPSTPTTERIVSYNPLRPSSPRLSSPTTATPTTSATTSAPATSGKGLSSSLSSRPPPPASPLHQRRLSHLLQPSTTAIGAASDAVKTTADQGLRTIGTTLDNSFKFLFGRLKEQEMSKDGNVTVVIPKTLDDARKLVSPTEQVDDGRCAIPGQTQELVEEAMTKPDDKVLDLVGGRRVTRDHSVDSTRSNNSGKPASFGGDQEPGVTSAPIPSSGPSTAGNAAMESMRNLGNSLNPLNRFAGMNVMRGFGRSVSNTPPAVSDSAEKSKELESGEAKTTANPQSENGQMRKIAPPITRFLEISDPGELRIAEVKDLLEDYGRLARALKDLRAF